MRVEGMKLRIVVFTARNPADAVHVSSHDGEASAVREARRFLDAWGGRAELRDEETGEVHLELAAEL
jgi:hypothetical protein